MAQHLTITKLVGSEMIPHLDALGALRIRVFKEFPYLYEGSLEYEREYLKTYANSSRSGIFMVKDDASGQVVGVSTCIPMSDECAEFQAPFHQLGIPLENIFYFGESILLPAYRGLGLGKRFFELREQHALGHGAVLTAFCAVEREKNHPARPTDYRELHPFWEGQGYLKHDSLQTCFDWREIGQKVESTHTLTFWTKSWNQ